MSLVALVGGALALPGCCRQHLARGARAARRCSAASTASASSSACWSRSWRWRAPRSTRCSARAGCSRSCCCAGRVACCAAALAAAGTAASTGATAPRVPVDRRRSRCSGSIGVRLRASAPRGRPSSTGSPRSTLLGGAGLVTCLTFVWFSAPDLALTQLVGRGRHDRAVPARPALAAQARPSTDDPRTARARAAAPRARPRARRRRRRRHGGARPTRCMTRPAPRQHLAASSSSSALPEGGGTQRRQRDPGRLPRLRHARRDHRARRRRADRLRAAAALPAGRPRASSCPAAAARPERLRRRAEPRPRGRRHGRATTCWCPRCIMQLAVPGHHRARRSTCSCAATTSRAAASSPASALAIALHPAVHGRRHAAGSRTRLRILPAALDRHRPAAGRARPALARWLFGYPFLTSHSALRRRCR